VLLQSWWHIKSLGSRCVRRVSPAHPPRAAVSGDQHASHAETMIILFAILLFLNSYEFKSASKCQQDVRCEVHGPQAWVLSHLSQIYGVGQSCEVPAFKMVRAMTLMKSQSCEKAGGQCFHLRSSTCRRCCHCTRQSTRLEIEVRKMYRHKSNNIQSGNFKEQGG
jgi:hypothetical protein